MSEGRFFARRVLPAVAVVAVLFVIAGVIWSATRRSERAPAPLVPAGPPVVKAGVEFVPLRHADAPPDSVSGYGVRLPAGATADALKAGKTVIVPGPNGGTIEISQAEPTAPPAGKK
jgi:hypothetical protein